jgi:hypothetical protein
VSFNILNEKTQVDNIGAITLYVEVINKSNNAVTILKPATDYRQKWRYYKCNIIKCDDIPLWASMEHEYFPYEESDLLKIPAKSKVVISINGRNNGNMLSCNSKNFELKLSYDAGKLLKDFNIEKANLDEIKVLKKLTPIKIESKIVNINIY